MEGCTVSTFVSRSFLPDCCYFLFTYLPPQLGLGLGIKGGPFGLRGLVVVEVLGYVLNGHNGPQFVPNLTNEVLLTPFGKGQIVALLVTKDDELGLFNLNGQPRGILSAAVNEV